MSCNGGLGPEDLLEELSGRSDPDSGGGFSRLALHSQNADDVLEYLSIMW